MSRSKISRSNAASQKLGDEIERLVEGRDLCKGVYEFMVDTSVHSKGEIVERDPEFFKVFEDHEMVRRLM
jgi:hypothetical protein